MFGVLTEKLQQAFTNLTGKGKMSETNVSDAVRQVRLALLEADVSYSVVKDFIKKVKEKALGEKVLRSVTPSQQFIQIIHEELVSLMGTTEAEAKINQKKNKHGMTVLMLSGLQGSGKTTHCVKLANLLKKDNQYNNPLIIAADLQRPAAILQLKKLAEQVNVPVFAVEDEKNPLSVVREGVKAAQDREVDLLIVDTAGRLNVDEELMQELREIKNIVDPSESLFVANAALGQDAVTTAQTFHEKIGITGVILTMLDGDARGGAAISIRHITGQPLKFEGIGEKVGDIQPFHPASMADRILGMGDTINLVRRAQEHFDEESEKELEEKLRKASFTFKDYLQQMQMMKKMGSIKSLLSMIPGLSNKMDLLDASEGKFKIVEAIIRSMTRKERLMDKLGMGRRRRIAKGSGVSLDEVNKLIKSFDKAKQLMKNLPNMKNLEKMMGGSKWH